MPSLSSGRDNTKADGCGDDDMATILWDFHVRHPRGAMLSRATIIGRLSADMAQTLSPRVLASGQSQLRNDAT
jgi:hypothetical protein